MRLLFLGLARNCADSLPRFFDFVRKVGALGYRCHIVIGENGSSDGTRDVIRANSSDLDVCVEDTGFIEVHEKRLQRMAVARERLLQMGRERYGHVDFIVVCDLDSVMRRPPAAASFSTAVQHLSNRDDIYAKSASSYPYYYDLLAYNDDIAHNNTLAADIERAKRRPWSYFLFMNRNVYRKQKEVSSQLPRLVVSAFNGMCIYKPNYYLTSSYNIGDDFSRCEHLALNTNIFRSSGRKIWISDTLQIATPDEHGPATFVPFWTKRIVKLISRVLPRRGSP